MSRSRAGKMERRGITTFNKEKFTTAIDFFLEAINLEPGNPRFHYNMSLALAKLGELRTAMRYLKQCMSLRKENPRAMRLLEYLLDLNDKRATAKIPPEELEWIGDLLEERSFFINHVDLYPQLDDFMNFLEHPMDITRYSPSPLTLKSKDLDGNNHPEIEIKNTRIGELYMLNMISRWGYRHLALINLDSLSREELLQYLANNYTGLPEDEKIAALIWCFGVGKQLYEDADYRDASEIFEFLVGLEPDRIAVLFQCANALRDSGELDLVTRSIMYYKRIITIHSSNPLAWQNLAVSYAIMGDFQRELFCLKKAAFHGSSGIDHGRIAYLETITASRDPFS
ncbi:hypothetical protein GF325_00940 [Candidatus Bathyarchaeota archaeon]|nr:hypothetical protein [Candidatus Bathyarchaeota archaeon]